MILIATGSEIALAVEAHEQLLAEGVRSRVVSMPSWDIFEHQPQEYRDSVLPPEVTARVAIEQASAFGWERYVGPTGRVIGMQTFGASAPLKALQKEYGFTVDNVVAAAKAQLAPAARPDHDQDDPDWLWPRRRHGGGACRRTGGAAQDLDAVAPEPPSRFWPISWLLIRVTWALLLIHLVEIAVWALLTSVGRLPARRRVGLLFFRGHYATVGYGDVVLQQPWRMLGPVEGLTGIMMCGLSTGFFFAVLNRVFRRQYSATPIVRSGT